VALAVPPFRKKIRVITGLSLEAKMPNLKFVPLDILELLAFNAKNLWGHVTLPTPLFRKNFSRVTSRLSLGACTPNLKFVPLVILELLAFNAQKIKASRDPGHAPFSNKFSAVM